MADGSCKRLADVQVGDTVTGVEPKGDVYRIVDTPVLAKVATRNRGYRIALVDGKEAICSADHRWLTDHGWKRTSSPDSPLTVNDSIRSLRVSQHSRNVREFDGLANTSVRIASIEDLGAERDMLDITTGTKNFIANGLVTHNCYVPRILRAHLARGGTVSQARQVFDEGAIPRDHFLENLTADAKKYQACNITAQVMLSFTTDPYHPGDTSLTRETLETIKRYGMGICTLTKGGTRALRDLDLFRPERDAFATTLTSLDPEFSAKWERGAALPNDRLDAIRGFHSRRIFTWVSLEPVLDTDATIEIIRRTYKFVDLFKIGRVNYSGLTKKIDWKRFTHDVLKVVNELGVKHYIKADLQPFLPSEYHNPMRVDQFQKPNGPRTIPLVQIDPTEKAETGDGKRHPDCSGT
ncbi:MAG: hypothetical protein ACTHN5_12190 [Phycisphaerae bacterium]